MLGFIGKIGTDKGTRIRVEKAQLAARSSMSAALTAAPDPRDARRRLSREGMRVGRGGLTMCSPPRSRNSAFGERTATWDARISLTRALTDRPSAAARFFNLASNWSSNLVISCRICLDDSTSVRSDIIDVGEIAVDELTAGPSRAKDRSE